MKKTEKELKECLTPEQYCVLREKGTEAPFTGKLLHNNEKGTYTCAACGNKIFKSDKKFDSGTGWPSFYDAIKGSIKLEEDKNHGMNRIEIICANCSSHLGHVFNDGPKPTNKRYCINSASMDFKKQKKGNL